MTKSISFALKAEMPGALSRLATCMKITRTDGTVYGFTSYDKPLLIDGITYEPAASFTPTDIESGSNMDVDNLNVEGVLSSDSITEDDLRAGRWDYAAFRIFQVNWDDLTMGDKKDRAGTLGVVAVHRQHFVAELLGLLDAYGINIIEITVPGCRASLGDSRCGVSLIGSPSFTVTGTIDTADTDFFTLHDADRTEADGYFDEGVITFTDGDNAGLSFEVKAYIVGTWITKTPYPYDATGASYTMTRGCDRRLSTCRDTFGNAANFRGEPWLRGPDAAIQIGRRT